MTVSRDLRLWIKRNEKAHLASLFEFLSFPSVTHNVEATKKCASWLRDALDGIGMEAGILETGGNPAVVAQKIVSPSAPTLLFYGHYDVQPADPLSEWSTPPFSPRLEADRVFARGAADDKGQVQCFLLAIKALRELGANVLANVKCLFEGEEEAGSPHLAKLVEANKEVLKADFALALDGNRHYTDKPTLIFGVRGGVWAEISLHTSKREFHVSYENVVPNAAEQVARITSSLWTADGQVALSGFYEDILPPSQAELEMLSKLRFDSKTLADESGLEEAAGIDTVDFYRRMMFQPTLTVTGLSAGYSGSGSKATIPTHGVLKLDIRLAPNQKPERILQALTTHVGEICPKASLQVLSQLPPARTNVELPSVKKFISAFADAAGDELALIPSFGGSGPHFVFLDILKVPFVWMPLAQADCRAHGANENLSKAAFHEGIETIASLLTHPWYEEE